MYKIQLMKPWITDAEKQAVLDVMDSGWLTEGEKVAEFEEALAKYVGVKHAIVVPNATIGMWLALYDIAGPGAPVAVPAFTHPATGLAALQSDCRLWFCDIDRSTGCVDQYLFDAVAHRFNLDAVVPVSWGGNPLSPELYDEARDYGVHVVEDAACSLGASDVSGAKVGTRALATVFSFHPRKLCTTGEGGAIVTDHDGIAFRLRKMKNFGGTRFAGGTNAKMSDINAAIGVVQLGHLDKIIKGRNHLAIRYDKLCSDAGIRWLLPEIGLGRRAYQSYCAYVPHRDRLIRDLAKLGIETQIGTYYIPDYPPFLCRAEFPHSRVLSEHLLTLPLHHEITFEDQEFVVESIVSLLRKYGDNGD